MKAVYLIPAHKTNMCWRDLNSDLDEHCSHTGSLKPVSDGNIGGLCRGPLTKLFNFVRG